jgi:hypothetical protein
MHRRVLLALATALLTLPVARASHALNVPKPVKPEELDQMLAPIALYPDSLLSQVLMAATYPLEVVEAARWSKANPNLKGNAAVAAVKDEDWDVSVKSLVAVPQVLVQLNEHLDWTQKLGDAMIGQQQDVANSIQRLRARAADAGNLNSTPQQLITSQGSGDDRTIAIEPSDPDVIYVPSYSPSWAYEPWPYPAYPPVYYPPAPGYGYGTAPMAGLLFGAGIAAGGAIFCGWNWGRGNSYVNVNVNRAVNIDNHFDRNRFANDNHWQHDPVHRKGVAYRDPPTRAYFGQNHPGAEQRQQFLGRLEQRPGGGQIANRPQANVLPNPPQGAGGGQPHPALGNRGGGRPGDGQIANRPQVNVRPNLPQSAGGGQPHPALSNGGGGRPGGGPRGGRR